MQFCHRSQLGMPDNRYVRASRPRLALRITDDAPGSPQTVAVIGTGIATGPGVTFSPAVPSFPTITQGTSGGAQTLTVLNSGTTSLHISSVVLGGPNPSRFNLPNNCTPPVAPTASCTDSLGFNPPAPPQRT